MTDTKNTRSSLPQPYQTGAGTFNHLREGEHLGVTRALTPPMSYGRGCSPLVRKIQFSWTQVGR